MKTSKSGLIRSIATPAVIGAGFIFLAALATRGDERPGATHPATDAERIKRGEYLVTIGGCNDCHTPWKMGARGPEPDMSRRLSGHPEAMVVERPHQMTDGAWAAAVAPTMTAWSGPWGVSFTANLTPDEDTGLGAWNEEIFIQTMRTGRHWGQSRPILPPMPWFNYGKMSDDDLRAVFAYLRSIPPVHNRVPQPLPPGGAEVAANEQDWN